MITEWRKEDLENKRNKIGVDWEKMKMTLTRGFKMAQCTRPKDCLKKPPLWQIIQRSSKFSGMSINSYQNTRHDISEDSLLQ
jgi:hypothetical protein